MTGASNVHTRFTYVNFTHYTYSPIKPTVAFSNERQVTTSRINYPIIYNKKYIILSLNSFNSHSISYIIQIHISRLWSQHFNEIIHEETFYRNVPIRTNPYCDDDYKKFSTVPVLASCCWLSIIGTVMGITNIKYWASIGKTGLSQYWATVLTCHYWRING